MTFAYNYLKQQGAMKGTDYEYKSIDQPCKQKESEYVAQIIRYVELPAQDSVALKRAVAENIVSVAVDARSWMTYMGGIIKDNCENKLNHGVVIVGYGIEESTGQNYGVCGINMVNSYVELVVEAH